MSKSLFDQFVIEPFLESINKYSERNAFCINDEFYSYKFFGNKISGIRLALKGINHTNRYIGLVANDDLETYASIIALWAEGLAYVPLHPQQPIERCEEIASQMKLSLILDSSQQSRYINHTVIATSEVEGSADFLDFNKSIEDDISAYVLFTSGSTGMPKGVTISRKNLAAFMDSFWSTGISINETDKCLQCFDLTFDVSVQSFLAPLIKGACIYTIPHDQIKFSYVYGLLTEHNLTFGAMAPSMLRYLRPYFDEIEAPDMKCCILTAEASPLDLVMEWSKCIPYSAVYNFYGPTEATIYCTFKQLTLDGNDKSLNGMLSIGKPLKHVDAIVVDDEGNVLEQGQKGELCVSGEQITPGYWNNQDRNDAAFFHKEIDGTIQRLYHTGDLCFLDGDGDIMLYGRLDSQAKIQGYRVELGEIEFHARQFLAGNNAVVLTFNNATGNTELALFIEGRQIDTKPLENHLKSKMPAYMIPTRIIFEQTFELNSNGKVDKLKLKGKLS